MSTFPLHCEIIVGPLLLILFSPSFSPLLGIWISCDKCCWMTGWVNPHDDSLPLCQLRTLKHEGWKEPHSSYGSISSFQRWGLQRSDVIKATYWEHHMAYHHLKSQPRPPSTKHFFSFIHGRYTEHIHCDMPCRYYSEKGRDGFSSHSLQSWRL